MPPARTLRFAIVPRKMGGNALNLSRAGIEARINAGRLKVATIGNSRFPCAKEVIETFQGDRDLASKAREILEDCARNRKTTTYGPFMSELGMTTQNPHHRSKTYGPFMSELGMTTQNPHHRSKIGSILGALSKDTFSLEMESCCPSLSTDNPWEKLVRVRHFSNLQQIWVSRGTTPRTSSRNTQNVSGLHIHANGPVEISDPLSVRRLFDGQGLMTI